MIKKQYRNTIIIWLILAIITAIVFVKVQAPWLVQCMHLSSEGVPTQGLITKLDPNYHATVHFSYQVKSETFYNQNFWNNSGFEDLKIGDPVLVYYLPKTPARSCVGNPQHKLTNEIFSVLVVSIFVPAGLLLIVWLNLLRKSNRDR